MGLDSLTSDFIFRSLNTLALSQFSVPRTRKPETRPSTNPWPKLKLTLQSHSHLTLVRYLLASPSLHFQAVPLHPLFFPSSRQVVLHLFCPPPLKRLIAFPSLSAHRPLTQPSQSGRETQKVPKKSAQASQPCLSKLRPNPTQSTLFHFLGALHPAMLCWQPRAKSQQRQH